MWPLYRNGYRWVVKKNSEMKTIRTSPVFSLIILRNLEQSRLRKVIFNWPKVRSLTAHRDENSNITF